MFVSTSLPSWWTLFRTLFSLRRRNVVLLGVWHPVFFADALLNILGFVSGRRVLIPTQSLSPIDWEKHRWTKRWLSPYVGAALRRYDSVIFASEGERAVSRPQFPDDKCEVIYHPIRVEPRELRLSQPESPRAAFFARLHPQKDPELFLAAARALPEEWTFDVIGAGDSTYTAALKSSLDESLSRRTNWHGWMAQVDAHALLGSATALVVSSKDENYCHAAVEAMAIGIPVIAVERVAIAIDLKKHRTGIVCGATPRGIANALNAIQGDDGLRNALVTNGRKFAEMRRNGTDVSRIRKALVGIER
jgi:glycosyltransferase involved in cell wall biosynthesis